MPYLSVTSSRASSSKPGNVCLVSIKWVNKQKKKLVLNTIGYKNHALEYIMIVQDQLNTIKKFPKKKIDQKLEAKKVSKTSCDILNLKLIILIKN
ncbi:hypothetical protein BpHYR1_040888 [Brachionus plicatilis]|uniref:Uncharacterized protein n=1 Tax=Brachionus plicatilis TaxID=10195 RepID=A0A3M7RSL9_BRAPC|nr:hypothetical protein BpHYR1_040888 [Brachionus plicatilis]